MRPPALALPLLLVSAALLAGCTTPAALDDGGGPGSGPGAVEAGPRAVVAFIDSGINPYHAAFRDASPRAYAHPSTYLPGYPADAVAVNLTFDAEDLKAAIAADCKTWRSLQPDTLYWFPGTRVVGAITVSTDWTGVLTYQGQFECGDEQEGRYPPVVFGSSHGTMTASRGAGNEYGACPECLIVMVHGFGPDHVTWAADQPWIDVQSNSWGPFLPLFLPSGHPARILASDGPFVRAVEAAAARQPAFWATGNGALTRGGVVGHPMILAPHATPSTIRVGGHDSGRVIVWHGFTPDVVSDACWSWAAEHETLDESTPRTGGGTSGATPFAAGIAARIVLDARGILGDHRTGVREGGVLAQGPEGLVPDGFLADGDLAIPELKELLFHLADPRPDRIEQDGDACEPTEDPFYALYPALPVEWKTVPDGPAGIPLVGFGAVTPATAEAAALVLRGEAPLPERAEEHAFFAAERAARQATHDALSKAP